MDTWWCWHICKGAEKLTHLHFGVGTLGGDAFEKIKCIFSIAPVGNLEKLRECFSHRTLVLAAPDAGPERPVWCLWLRCAERTGRWHRTLAPDAGRLLFKRPVVCDVSERARGVSDR